MGVHVAPNKDNEWETEGKAVVLPSWSLTDLPLEIITQVCLALSCRKTPWLRGIGPFAETCKLFWSECYKNERFVQRAIYAYPLVNARCLSDLLALPQSCIQRACKDVGLFPYGRSYPSFTLFSHALVKHGGWAGVLDRKRVHHKLRKRTRHLRQLRLVR